MLITHDPGELWSRMLILIYKEKAGIAPCFETKPEVSYGRVDNSAGLCAGNILKTLWNKTTKNHPIMWVQCI